MNFNLTQIDLTQILVAIITLLGAIAARYLVPLLKEKLSNEQQSILNKLIKIGVYAAEQTILGPGKGEERKKFVQDLLEKNGYSVDLEAVDAAIEATVRELKIEQGQMKKPEDQ